MFLIFHSLQNVPWTISCSQCRFILVYYWFSFLSHNVAEGLVLLGNGQAGLSYSLFPLPLFSYFPYPLSFPSRKWKKLPGRSWILTPQSLCQQSKTVGKQLPPQPCKTLNTSSSRWKLRTKKALAILPNAPRNTPLGLQGSSKKFMLTCEWSIYEGCSEL